jgi:hypothetical protein
LSLQRSAKGKGKDKETYSIPILAILELTSLVVSHLSMNEQDGEVDDVEVREGARESCRETPGPTVQHKRGKGRVNVSLA